jgi:hypothetical protein
MSFNAASELYVAALRASRARPDVVRKAWVSAAARERHEPRLHAARDAWAVAEWRSADGVRPCALISVTAAGYGAFIARLEDSGLTFTPLRAIDITPPGSAERIVSTELGVGAARNVKALRRAWIRRDNDAIGALLGYPTCCRAAFCRRFLEGGVGDPTWLAGAATPGARLTERGVSVHAASATSILLRRIGVRAIPHFPCSFGCEPSLRLSLEMTDLARANGHGEAMDALNAMLDWPARWSSLHGLSETRTPVLKIATHSDNTASAFTLDWLGATIPDEAARGLDFPYTPQHAPRPANALATAGSMAD